MIDCIVLLLLGGLMFVAAMVFLYCVVEILSE